MNVKAPLNRIERRKIEFRDRITAAALRLFEEKGVADTSVASIIKEADIAHKTFFNHFPSKDHLLQYIVGTFSDYAYSIFRENFKRFPDPRQRIDYCYTSIAHALEPLDPLYKELVNLYLIAGSSASDLRTVQKQKIDEVVGQIVSDAQAQGLLRPGLSVETSTEVLVGICVGILLNWTLEEGYPLVERMKAVIGFINTTVFID